jgi:Ca-activated chloride channel homolog
MRRHSLFSILTTLSLGLALPAASPQTTTSKPAAASGSATEATYVELILDASGSMYSALPAGGTRIAAAKEVLGSFINKLPVDPNLNVGLRIYGSKVTAGKPGACKDSGLVIPMKGIDRTALRQTVVATIPKGSTPIAYSLEQAAGDFVADKSRKLIVLVTDGKESCDGDLKKVVQLFKDKGIVVDIRIIGIDLDETAQKSFDGVGTFENATSGEQLAAALGKATQAVAKPAETKLPVTVLLTSGGKPVASGPKVSFTNTVGTKVTTDLSNANAKYTAQLAPGEYSAKIEVAGSPAINVGGLSVAVGAANTFTFEVGVAAPVTLDFTPKPPQAGGKLKASFKGAPATSTKDWIAISHKTDADTKYISWQYVKGASGSAELDMPDELAEFELRYYLANPDGTSRIIGRSASFKPVRAKASLDAPSEAIAGTNVSVKWTGPNNEYDYVSIAPKGAPKNKYGDYRYTSQGNPLVITMPQAAGEYEFRYLNDRSEAILASKPITIKAGTYAVDAPSEALAGAKIKVKWTGPNNEYDYVAVAAKGAPKGKYGDYRYTSQGNPLEITMPQTAGEYEIRYLNDRAETIFASKPIKITAGTYSVDAPTEALAGTNIKVKWSGPNNDNDYVAVAAKGAPKDKYEHFRYTSQGNPLEITMPQTAGEYEIRYLNDRADKVLASKPIKVKAGTYTLDAPKEVPVGKEFNIKWTGPEGEYDFIAIAAKGAPKGNYIDYRYTSQGNPTVLTAPAKAGQYEILYANDRVDKPFLVRPITVK